MIKKLRLLAAFFVFFSFKKIKNASHSATIPSLLKNRRGGLGRGGVVFVRMLLAFCTWVKSGTTVR